MRVDASPHDVGAYNLVRAARADKECFANVSCVCLLTLALHDDAFGRALLRVIHPFGCSQSIQDL
jgi:hypothetical protein